MLQNGIPTNGLVEIKINPSDQERPTHDTRGKRSA
jgi:hypothetical protein